MTKPQEGDMPERIWLTNNPSMWVVDLSKPMWPVIGNPEPPTAEYVRADIAATERDTLAKALEVAVKLLREYRACGWGSGKYIPKTLYHENSETLSEIERIKGEK